MDLTRLFDALAPPLCWECGGVAVRGQPLCRSCRGRLRWLAPDPLDSSAWAPVAYEGPARSLVAALKFRGATGVAEAMAAQIVATAPSGFLEAALVPVPLHPARQRARGFNQAERLARAVASLTGQTVLGCLRRTGTPGTQMGRPRAERLVALEDAFAVRAGLSLPPCVTLVDDVITTGATVAACAAALRCAGAHKVATLAYARTPTR